MITFISVAIKLMCGECFNCFTLWAKRRVDKVSDRSER